MWTVETLAAQERCDCECWNIPNSEGNTPVMEAVMDQQEDICKILLKCPRVDSPERNLVGS